MSEHYYYASGSKRNGPVPGATLRELANNGELKRTDKVWCRGMKEWQPAESLAKLFDELPPDLESEATLEVPPLLPVDDSTIATVAPSDVSEAGAPPNELSIATTTGSETTQAKDEGVRLPIGARVAIGVVACVVIVGATLVSAGPLKALWGPTRRDAPTNERDNSTITPERPSIIAWIEARPSGQRFAARCREIGMDDADIAKTYRDLTQYNDVPNLDGRDLVDTAVDTMVQQGKWHVER